MDTANVRPLKPANDYIELVRKHGNQTLERITMPLINGKPVDLRPAKTYQSPFLNADFGSDKISVSVGLVHRL